MDDSTKGLTTEDVVKMNKEFLEDGGYLKRREGYNSFWQLLVFLFRTNKRNKKWRVSAKYQIILPVKWI